MPETIEVLKILYLLCRLDWLTTVKFPVSLAILAKLDSPDMCDLSDEQDIKKKGAFVHFFYEFDC